MHKAKNAIILAAGLGSRLRPLTTHLPKPLIPINGLPLIEHQIGYLQLNHIKQIYIVIGYLKEKFTYLKDKYKNIHLIENHDYANKNNISSLYVALDYLSDSYVIEGDIFVRNNVFSLYHKTSNICCVYEENKSHEWGIISDETGRVKDIQFTAYQQWCLIGISFWTKEDSLKIKQYINDVYHQKQYHKVFWEEASYIPRLKEFNIKVNRLMKESVAEIDTFQDLIAHNQNYHLFVNKKSLNFTTDSVVIIKNGITNETYVFNHRKNEYIIRFPHRCNKFIDRKEELNNIQYIAPLGINEKVMLFDTLSGMKISKKIDGRCLTSIEARKYSEKIALIIKKIHEMPHKFSLSHFDPLNLMNTYINQNRAYLSDEYNALIKEITLYIKKYLIIDKICFCHNDLVPENFIKNNQGIYLIDWEYAKINDPLFDVASLFDECQYDVTDQMQFMNNYGLSFDTTLDNKIKFWRAYLNILWSIWCFFYEETDYLDMYRKTRLDKAKQIFGLLN